MENSIHIHLILCFLIRTTLLFLIFFDRNLSFFTVFIKLLHPPLKLILSLSFGSSSEMVSYVLFLHIKFLNYVPNDTLIEIIYVCHTFQHFIYLSGHTEWTLLHIMLFVHFQNSSYCPFRNFSYLLHPLSVAVSCILPAPLFSKSVYIQNNFPHLPCFCQIQFWMCQWHNYRDIKPTLLTLR
jgi:hypothetical protein